MTIDWNNVEAGTEVKVDGESGQYVFHSYRNGDVTVWGGSRNPNGIRMFRAFTADRCRIIRRRSETTKFQASPAIPPRPRTGRR